MQPYILSSLTLSLCVIFVNKGYLLASKRSKFSRSSFLVISIILTFKTDHTGQMPPNSTIYGGYPSFYFEAIAQDQYDLLFEIWDVAVETGNGYDYFDARTVLDMGISGVFGEGGWYVRP